MSDKQANVIEAEICYLIHDYSTSSTTSPQLLTTTTTTMKAKIDAEKLLHEFGKYGKYQVIVIN